MNRYPASPREFEDLMAYLARIAAEHHPAVVRMMFEEVAVCPICGEAVRRCDARRLVGDQLMHLGCSSEAGGRKVPVG